MWEDPVDEFPTPEAAAEDFAKIYNGISIINNVELKSTIYKIGDSYSYTVPKGFITTDSDGNNVSSGIAGEVEYPPQGTIAVGDVHSHSHDNAGRIGTFTKPSLFNDNDFSEQDKITNREKAEKQNGYKSFVSTPNGKLLAHTPGQPKIVNGKRNTIYTISTDIPSDPKSPTRVNNISPNVVPNIMPVINKNGFLLKSTEIKMKF